MVDALNEEPPQKPRYVPFIRHTGVRAAIGFILLALSVAAAWEIHGRGSLVAVGAVHWIAWVVAVLLTHKYVHKYPQRYVSYLLASHLKAAVVMALGVFSLCLIAGTVSLQVLWTSYAFFILADFIVSLPRRRETGGRPLSEIIRSLREEDSPPEQCHDSSGSVDVPNSDAGSAAGPVRAVLDDPSVDYIEQNVSDLRVSSDEVMALDDIPEADGKGSPTTIRLIVGRTRLNDVARLNMFLQFCASHLVMGGYLVIRYKPLENVYKDLRRRYTGVLYYPVCLLHYTWYRAMPRIPWLDKIYFAPKMLWMDRLCLAITKKRNRVLSKAEAWGRLAFCGMDVVAESEECDENGELTVIAKRVALPVQGRRPTYYLVVPLAKVGLAGETVYAHKIRTMYSFSEFIQKRLFQDHGLTASGKFARDFRLTTFGKFIRRYWLDELPQIFDWLRGDVKLVGMRATSRHFLTLYPDGVIERYLQIKPGLIPPIFDDNTDSFDDIIRIERDYLNSYWDQPIRTDVRNLIRTFTDIVFRGVRSK